jgi:Wnt and FGF inhibitory regulator
MGKLAKKIFSSGRHTGSSHNYHAGMYHGYNYRPDRYSNINGEVCVNNENYDGIKYGQFICPIDGFDYDEIKCCGPIGQQYCCTPAESAAYRMSGPGSSYNRDNNNIDRNDYDNHHHNRRKKTNHGAIAGSVIGVIIIFVLLIIAGVVLIWYCKKRIYNRVPTNL